MKKKKNKVGSVATFDRNLSRRMAIIYNHEIAGLFDSFDKGYFVFNLDPELEEYRQDKKREYTWKIKQLQKMTKEQRERYHKYRKLALD